MAKTEDGRFVAVDHKGDVIPEGAIRETEIEAVATLCREQAKLQLENANADPTAWGRRLREAKMEKVQVQNPATK